MIKRFLFWFKVDKLGPEVPLTYWMLFFPSLMRFICRKKFGNFGKGSELRPGSHIDVCSKIYIGEKVTIRPGSFIYADPRKNAGKVIIEDKVLLGPQIQIYTNDHNFNLEDVPIYDQGYGLPDENDSVVIKSGAWIGAGSIILKGVIIGKNSVVGAGSVVTKNIPENTVAVGIPAKVIKKIND